MAASDDESPGSPALGFDSRDPAAAVLRMRQRREPRPDQQGRAMMGESSIPRFNLMVCPICRKRKAKRFCPARGDSICSVCCGTEREVTIDCVADCPHLVSSRVYDYERKDIDWSKRPFRDTKIEASFLERHTAPLNALVYAICKYASEDRLLVDSDVLASIEALVETYRTLSTGIYYEKPPDYHAQRELYGRLKGAVEEYRETETRQTGLNTVRDAEVRDVLIFLAQLGFARSNGRPKGRAFLELLRNEFTSGKFDKSASNIVLLS